MEVVKWENRYRVRSKFYQIRATRRGEDIIFLGMLYQCRELSGAIFSFPQGKAFANEGKKARIPL